MQPGEKIEQYTLIEQIGQGGQAAVWSAEDNLLKRTVAIKTINTTTQIQPNTDQSSAPSGSIPTLAEQSDRFRIEAQTIADLEHPHILPIYSYGQTGDWLYIVMRYMPGGTLKKLIKHGGIPLADLIKLAMPLADALDQAHAKNVVHRDIKSVNILLDAQHRPYLADFGLSVTLGTGDTKSGSGTLAYMSPEQLRGDSFDHRSDIYAFGILMYEMLTGSVPTVDTMHWNLMQMMNGVELPEFVGIPIEVIEVLRRATALKAEDRYNTATEVVEALKETTVTREEVIFDDGILIDIVETDPAMQASVEAFRLFDDAVARWADGAGRFRFFEEDFRFVESYYSSNDAWGIDLDDAARRLMLRAALEHDYHLDMWWDKVENTADRRAVALQALSSELPTARLRAIEKLMTIEDSMPPAIPTRVASVISTDPDPAVRLAGIALLEKRATKPHGNQHQWQPSAYNPTIDGILADLAVNDYVTALAASGATAAQTTAAQIDPEVRGAASRAISHLRSTTATAKIAHMAQGKSVVTSDTGISTVMHAQKVDADQADRALQSLIAIRAEAPNFPEEVSSDLRLRVFNALTIRQLFGKGFVRQYLAALGGFGLGWAILQYNQFGVITGATGSANVGQAVGNAVASGVLYGALVAVALLVAILPAERLVAWNRLARIALSTVLGTVVTFLAFMGLRTFYYFINDPLADNEPIFFVGLSLLFIIGFAVANGLVSGRKLTGSTWVKPLVLSGFATVGTFAALYASHLLYLNFQTYNALLVAFSEDTAVTYSIVMALSLGIVTYLPEWIAFFRSLGRKSI